jgi:hypothetical protein
MSEHRTSVWNRIAEGSQQAECTCGWKGPKRTAIGGLAYTDADLHIDLALAAAVPLKETTNDGG